MKKYYLGIDIGTSGCKAVVYDDSGKQAALAYREYRIESLHNGWAELNAETVITCCFQVISETAAAVAPAPITGIGISSQGEAFTLIDQQGQVLCPALVSSDSRAVEYVTTWVERFGFEKLYRITGHTPHPMFSLFKLLWIRDHWPQIWGKASRILCFEDLLQYRLGIRDTAMGWPLAGRTMLFDIQNHRWHDEILNEVGIHPDQLSRPLPSGTIAGCVDPDIAASLNLSADTYVVTGGHDQPCCGLGAGAIIPGVAVFSAGTVECITPAFDRAIFSQSLRESNLCTYDHVVPGLFATVAFSLTGGNILKWFREELGSMESDLANQTGSDPYDLLIRQLPSGPTGLLVLPYFTPSGTPYFDPLAKGAIIGLDLSTTRYEILKALLEGVALEMRLNIEILEKSGCMVSELRLIGGGARSRILNQLRADVTGKPIAVLNVTEAGCRGVAILAKAAAEGVSAAGIAAQWTRITEKIHPDPENNYDRKFESFKQLYPVLQTIK